MYNLDPRVKESAGDVIEKQINAMQREILSRKYLLVISNLTIVTVFLNRLKTEGRPELAPITLLSVIRAKEYASQVDEFLRSML